MGSCSCYAMVWFGNDYKVRGEITYPFLYFNGVTVKA